MTHQWPEAKDIVVILLLYISAWTVYPQYFISTVDTTANWCPHSLHQIIGGQQVQTFYVGNEFFDGTLPIHCDQVAQRSDANEKQQSKITHQEFYKKLISFYSTIY